MAEALAMSAASGDTLLNILRLCSIISRLPKILCELSSHTDTAVHSNESKKLTYLTNDCRCGIVPSHSTCRSQTLYSFVVAWTSVGYITSDLSVALRVWK